MNKKYTAVVCHIPAIQANDKSAHSNLTQSIKRRKTNWTRPSDQRRNLCLYSSQATAEQQGHAVPGCHLTDGTTHKLF